MGLGNRVQESKPMKNKRRVNRRFNTFIEPRLTDIDHVQRDRNQQRDSNWIKKGSPK
jgi:hypothetical protein